ncbi:MAG: tripartite tricarboxylate transporter substrate binding protein [Proteobacteria bacterium]|nr:tripartite tricarboxylate transporter substrate binding protein [Pseudomonadota bacterium]
MKRFLKFSAAALLALCAGAWASAQTVYPTKPIHWISPWAPGGANDILSRAIGMEIAKTLGQPVIVDNKPGATGIIGTEMVAKAPPDGYTITLGAPGTHATAPSFYPRLPYDPVRDFTPIALVGTVPNVLVVHPSVPATTVRELVAYLKAHPGQLNFSSVGNGSMQHLSAELFKRDAGVDMTHVAYKGTSAALVDLMAGHVQVAFESMPAVLPLVNSGAVRAIAVTTPKRSSLMPNVPTMDESGLKGFDVTIWYGVFGPAGMQADVVDKLNRAVVGSLRTPEMSKRLADLGADVAGGSPAELGAYLRQQTGKWSKLIKEMNIKAE